VPALYAATAGYEIIEEVGIERIRANSLRQTELFIRLLDEAGFEGRLCRTEADARDLQTSLRGARQDTQARRRNSRPGRVATLARSSGAAVTGLGGLADYPR